MRDFPHCLRFPSLLTLRAVSKEVSKTESGRPSLLEVLTAFGKSGGEEDGEVRPSLQRGDSGNRDRR